MENKAQKKYRLNNPEKVKEIKKRSYIKNKDKSKEYYIKNREKILELRKRYRESNIEKISKIAKLWRKNNREKAKIYNSYWNKNNPEKRKIYINNWTKNKRKTDIKFNTNSKISCLIRQSIKANKNGRHWENLVDYTLTDLIKRLKKTLPKGYNWKDYLNGKLHIDHIIPIKAFKFKTPEDKEFKQCWSLYNLRLLPARENLSKSYSINNFIILSLLLKEGK